jgi:hypothetical protein
LYLEGNPLNIEAYCTYLPLIEENNPGIHLDYDSISDCDGDETPDACDEDTIDSDGDGVDDGEGIGHGCDNCPNTPNGPGLGTCAEIIGTIVKGTGVVCTEGGSECGGGEVCQMNQEDCNDNGIGDACECYANLDGDSNVYPSDLSVFLGEYGRTNCLTTPPPCEADIDGDGNVYPSDLSIFLEEYGRTDCPVIP